MNHPDPIDYTPDKPDTTPAQAPFTCYAPKPVKQPKGSGSVLRAAKWAVVALLVAGVVWRALG